jgi:PEP-CTERM/exosortase A-associated glycosyltransferase
MKVLHVFDHSLPLQSGYTFRSLALLREQRRRGWHTVHVTSGKQGASQSDADFIDSLVFHRTPPPALRAVPLLGQWAQVRALEARVRTLIEQHQPDLVHAHSPALNGLAALRAARACGVPVVYEIRAFWEDAAVDHGTAREDGWRYRLGRALENHVVSKVDAVFPICEGLRDDLIARGHPAQKFTVIPNAVDSKQFVFQPPRDTALAAALGLSGQPVLGFIGSFYAYEGLVDLIHALPAVLQHIPDLRVLLVGGGPTMAHVQALVAQLGLQTTVLLPGRVPHAEVDRYASLIDVFCFPRRRLRLTELVTPLKPLEAMAMGRPVLASDVGGHRELIRDRVTGRLFPAGDPDALAAAIVDLFDHPEDWAALGIAGRRYVEHHRRWSASVAAYVPAYAALLGEHFDSALKVRGGMRHA